VYVLAETLFGPAAYRRCRSSARNCENSLGQKVSVAACASVLDGGVVRVLRRLAAHPDPPAASRADTRPTRTIPRRRPSLRIWSLRLRKYSPRRIAGPVVPFDEGLPAQGGVNGFQGGLGVGASCRQDPDRTTCRGPGSWSRRGPRTPGSGRCTRGRCAWSPRTDRPAHRRKPEASARRKTSPGNGSSFATDAPVPTHPSSPAQEVHHRERLAGQGMTWRCIVLTFPKRDAHPTQLHEKVAGKTVRVR